MQLCLHAHTCDYNTTSGTNILCIDPFVSNAHTGANHSAASCLCQDTFDIHMQAISPGLQLLSLNLLMNWVAHACRGNMLRRAVQTEVTLADPLGSNLTYTKALCRVHCRRVTPLCCATGSLGSYQQAFAWQRSLVRCLVTNANKPSLHSKTSHILGDLLSSHNPRHAPLTPLGWLWGPERPA